MIDDLKPLMGKLALFAQDRLGFQRPPKLFLKNDAENSTNILGKTGYYDPAEESVVLYITGRHPKDILRSFAHELVHHTQNLRGDLSQKKIGPMSNTYAQDNEHLRNMEKEAYLLGNMCFRDWEDNHKFTIAESKLLKENNEMAIKINKEDLKEIIKKIVSERVKKKSRTQGRDAGGRRIKMDEVDGGCPKCREDGKEECDCEGVDEGVEEIEEQDASFGRRLPEEPKAKKNAAGDYVDNAGRVLTVHVDPESGVRTPPEFLNPATGEPWPANHKNSEDGRLINYREAGFRADRRKALAKAKKQRMQASAQFREKNPRRGPESMKVADPKRKGSPAPSTPSPVNEEYDMAYGRDDGSVLSAIQDLISSLSPQEKDQLLSTLQSEPQDFTHLGDDVGMDHEPTDSWGEETDFPSAEGCLGERRILTPEEESVINENRFDSRNNSLYNRLLKKWTK